MCARIFSLIQIALIAWIVLQLVASYGRLPWGHPVRKVLDALNSVFDPLLRPIRKVLPPVRIGGGGLDLSPLVLIIGIQILGGILCGFLG
ncbi:MAG: YggT family protein [Acidimicrobiia bacterium]|nr:YggT family protein [Acidimicrobiia bacterium]NNF63680.1 YggT family protein [Acidimicrobiia bacterium]